MKNQEACFSPFAAKEDASLLLEGVGREGKVWQVWQVWLGAHVASSGLARSRSVKPTVNGACASMEPTGIILTKSTASLVTAEMGADIFARVERRE